MLLDAASGSFARAARKLAWLNEWTSGADH
jgi:hypothetical protein